MERALNAWKYAGLPRKIDHSGSEWIVREHRRTWKLARQAAPECPEIAIGRRWRHALSARRSLFDKVSGEPPAPRIGDPRALMAGAGVSRTQPLVRLCRSTFGVAVDGLGQAVPSLCHLF